MVAWCRYWATHIFRKQNGEAESWANKGVRRVAEEGMGVVVFSWKEILGICGFWDGICQVEGLDIGLSVTVHTGLCGWRDIMKRCTLVPKGRGQNTEIRGCQLHIHRESGTR